MGMFYSLLSSEDEIVNTSDDDNLEKPTEETEENCPVKSL